MSQERNGVFSWFKGSSDVDAADKKAVHMHEKTLYVRREFNLTDTEHVIQDYFCACSHVQGRMYLTQNYIIWTPNMLLGTPLSIPYRKVTNIKKDRNILIFDNGLTVETDTASHFFSSLVHRDETFNLLVHLWKYPPSYVDYEDKEEEIHSSSSKTSHSQDSKNPNASMEKFPIPSKEAGGVKETPSPPSGFQNNGNQQMRQQLPAVDTQSTKRALKLATETRQIGADTLVEMTIQAEQLDRIERNVENVHSNLDKSDRLLRGMESIPGSIANAFQKEKSSSSSQFQLPDRTLKIERELPPVDYQVLEKVNSTDHLEPGILRFISDKFFIGDFNSKPRSPLWAYSSIESLVLRARHLHLDIRFSKDIPRVRLCSSFVQSIVNELVMRCKKDQVKVIFEPGSRVFSYGDPGYSVVETKSRKEKQEGSSFRRLVPPQQSVTKTIFKDADEKTKKDLLEQEQDLDDISVVLGDLTSIATTMGSELDRQNEQIDHVTGRVDLANSRLKKTNQRIDKMM